MKPVFRTAISIAAGALLWSAVSNVANADPADQARQNVHALLPGYLARDEQLDSRSFVPSAPTAGSAAQELDSAWAARMVKLQGSPRWTWAVRDADLKFPAAANVFVCATGIEISEQNTPTLYSLLRRSLTDIGLATYSAKNAYQRSRPFMVENTPVCTPEDEPELRKDGSYPSGHAAIGWGWALILAELVPSRANEILARGRYFGESRTVCNVHWYSDVVAGRMVGAAAVARLHAIPEFLAALAASRAEINLLLTKRHSLQVGCAEESTSLTLD
jgi:acid phosphatase (class A)